MPGRSFQTVLSWLKIPTRGVWLTREQSAWLLDEHKSNVSTVFRYRECGLSQARLLGRNQDGIRTVLAQREKMTTIAATPAAATAQAPRLSGRTWSLTPVPARCYHGRMACFTASPRAASQSSGSQPPVSQSRGSQSTAEPAVFSPPAQPVTTLLLLLACLLLFPPAPAQAQDWRSYGNDPGGMRYSQLDQINKDNVKNLEVAWVHDTGDWSDGTKLPTRSAFETTPLLVDGVLYVVTVFHRVLALDPETGKLLWEFDPKFDRTQRVNLYHNRGLAYRDDDGRKRIYLADQLGRLYSIDTATRELDPAFGQRGVVDLTAGMNLDKYPHLRYGVTSPVAPCADVVVVGGWVSDGEPQGPSGDIRAFDARTGKLAWRFHTVPRPGEFGHNTWQGDSWRDRSGVNAWSTMSVDPELGWVFVPLTSPGTDFYGGDRKGANLFSDAVVAIDCRTGKRQWHFQTIHHDLWDWDLPVYPNLVTVTREGKQIPAVAQITKTGFVFVLDRVTGRPLFPVEERPVEISTVPGEQSWPTQPFPVKPPPFARQSMTLDEITRVTPESRAQCMEMIDVAYADGPLFRAIGQKLTIMFPGTNGGPNWGGASFDPNEQVLFVNSMDVGAPKQLVARPEGSKVPFRSRGVKYGRFWDANQYPCQQPPWAHLTAIDLNSGEFRWRVVLGEIDELTKRGIPKTGAPNLGGSIVTAGGLVFIGATNDSRFRAFDKNTGAQLWETRLPASGHAIPMTYRGKKTGKQYVVIAAGGGNKYNETFSGKIVAFALR